MLKNQSNYELYHSFKRSQEYNERAFDFGVIDYIKLTKTRIASSRYLRFIEQCPCKIKRIKLEGFV